MATDPTEARPRTYYAKNLLGTQAQTNAAARLIAVLSVQSAAQGVRLAFLARRWGRDYQGVFRNTIPVRVELARRVSGRTRVDPDPVPIEELVAHAARYLPILREMEQEAVEALADARTEAVIRQMFTPDIKAVLLIRAPKRPPRAETNPKRGPGRPKGSVNRPKTITTAEPPAADGWQMPDGTILRT